MTLKQIVFAAGLLVATFTALAAPAYTATGKLTGAGGVDDVGIQIALNQAEAREIRRQVCRNTAASDCADRLNVEQGQTYLWLYCDAACVPQAWLESFPEHDGTTLKARHANQPVRVTFAEEMNRDRIAGPGEIKLLFVKEIRFLR